MMIRLFRSSWLVMLLTLGACQETPAERCQREAEEYNHTCPRRLDAQTTLDSMTFDRQDLAFIYYHTVNGAPDSLLAQHISQPEMKERSIQMLTNEAGMQYYLKHGITFRYLYFSQSTGTSLGEISITPDDYR